MAVDTRASGRRLADRVALITGGASGFGAASARRFVAEGAKIVVADIDDQQGTRVARELGASALFVHCDQRDRAQADLAVATALERWGRLDVLFANAGVGWSGTPDAIDDTAIDEVLGVDLVGPMHLTQAALPALRASGAARPGLGAALILTASGQGIYGTANQALYVTAKHGVIGWMRSMAQDLGPDNIRVNALCPGMADTPTTRRGVAALGKPADELLEEVRSVTPLRRLITPEDVANAALFLASDEARSIHGLALVVNAGGKHPYS
jgi:NAD(P)-dependent dehydrogenase (short-subunit alcohol dehydrogenase family)